MSSKLTSSQTIGPFSHEAWRWAVENTASVTSTAPTMVISGIIRDGDGNPINDAMIEAWMPDGAAAEAAHALPGFRRIPSDDSGAFHIEVSRQGAGTEGKPAMFVTVFSRGLCKHQFTAVFLEDDAGLAASDILQQVPAERRATLVARKIADARYEWDIWMQTDKETVFFDYM